MSLNRKYAWSFEFDAFPVDQIWHLHDQRGRAIGVAGVAGVEFVEARHGRGVRDDRERRGAPFGQAEAERVMEQLHPLRVVRIAAAAGSPLQVLVTNEGVSSGVFTLSCRAEPLDQ